MACEFAGETKSLADFYRVITNGIDATIDMPKERVPQDMHQLSDAILHGGFLEKNPWAFDNRLFSISPKEAACMDPQHRLLLEHTYQALIDAKINPRELKGTKCGVFVGLGTQDYARVMHQSMGFTGFHSKGSLGSMAAGRIAYHFDFIGPNLVIDTACSSSLVALHTAIESLESHACDIAIVGGATLILTVDYGLDLFHAGLLAKDGRCKPFSQAADGFARGEGAGVIVLQRREDVCKTNKRIYANLLGSAINSDGQSNGITAPSRMAQKQVIQNALTKADLLPEDINYIETHGTGTNLGDKIEFSALKDVYQGRDKPLYMGSVKGNIAHCEAAAGLAGVIKAALCAYYRVIPPHTEAMRVNPDLDTKSIQAIFPNQVQTDAAMVTGVSSFGMSGSNAHVIIGQEENTITDDFTPLHHFKRKILMPDYIHKGIELTPKEMTFEIAIDVFSDNATTKDAYIKQHIIHGQCILPGTYYISKSFELLQSNLCIATQKFVIQLENIAIISPVTFDSNTESTDVPVLKVILKRVNPLQYQLQYALLTQNTEQLTCELDVQLVTRGISCASTLFDRVQFENAKKNAPQTAALFYQNYAEKGVTYGPLFKRLNHYVRLDETTIIADILPLTESHVDAPLHSTHTALIDNFLQTIGLSIESVEGAYMPTMIGRCICYTQCGWDDVIHCLVKLTSQTSKYLKADIIAYDANGNCLMQLEDVLCKHVEVTEKKSASNVSCVQLLPYKGNMQHEPYLEQYQLMGEGKTQLETYLMNAKTKQDAPHLIYAIQKKAITTVADLLTAFNTLLNRLKASDARATNRIRCVSMLIEAEERHHIETIDFRSALMHAITRVFPTEFPDIQFRYFQYDIYSQTHINLLFSSYSSNSFIAQIKQGIVYTDQIKALETLPAKHILDSTGYYLVTGGFGGVGLHVVEHLIYHLGCKKLILTHQSETSLSLERLNWIEHLTKTHHVEIVTHCIDLSDQKAVKKWFLTLPRPLYGVFHLAGMNIDQTLQNVTTDTLSQTLAAKAAAWQLHTLSLEVKELKQFILFSSMATQISSPGQFAYTLANASLIDLATYRKQLNLPVKVIDWGPWENTGMMSRIDKQHTSSVAHADFVALSPSVCCTALSICLNTQNIEHLAVFERRQEILNNTKEESASQPLDIQSAFLQLISEETNYPEENIQMEDSLESLGLDSINTIRIRSALQTQFNVVIPVALLLDETTVLSVIQALNELSPADIAKPEAVEATAVNAVYPLSYNQFSIWYEQQATPEQTAYHCSIAWCIKGGSLKLKALETIWPTLLERHEMLRAVICLDENEIGYKVLSVSEALTHTAIIVDTLLPNTDIQAHIHSRITRNINFEHELPTKVYVLTSGHETYLVLASHHLIMDASAMFYVGEKLLSALCSPTFTLNYAPKNTTYASFVTYQRSQSEAVIQRATQHLLNQVLDEDGQLNTFDLPKSCSLESADLAKGNTITLNLSDEQMASLMTVPAKLRVHLCLSTWALVLARYTAASDLLVGVAFNGRTQQDWTNIVGHFINLLPLGISVDQNQTAVDYVEQVKQGLFELLAFQDVPLMRLMMTDAVKQALKGKKLLQTYFNYFDATGLNIAFDDSTLDIKPWVCPQQEAQFEVSLWVTQHKAGYAFDIKYLSDVFSEDLMQNLANSYQKLLLDLSQAILNPTQPVRLCDLQLVSTETEQAALTNLSLDIQHTRFVYDYFCEHVRTHPHAIAIEMKDCLVDYQTLDNMVNTCSEMIATAGIHSHETVAIFSPEKANVDFIVAVLALWKLGLSYVPIQSTYPWARIQYILDTVGCSVSLIVDDALEVTVHQKLVSHYDATALTTQPFEILNLCTVSPIVRDPLAYILFTSGSTGHPKGVLIEHSGLIDRLLWMKDHFGFSKDDKFLQSTRLTFDVSLPEFCLPLICGGRMVLFHPDDNPQAHHLVCNRHDVTIMSTVPSLFSLLQEDLSTCKAMKHVILIGEVVMPALVNQWLASKTNCLLHNLYGPTEATVYATAFACDKPIETAFVPIGAPARHVVPIVLDAYGNLVPNGVIGELYLSGTGVAKGYIGFDKASPFENNPLQSSDIKMYKTGDFVRWTQHHLLEYVGRKDNRIKLNGLLIELDEIEACALSAFPQIKNAAAMVVDLVNQDTTTQHIALCVMPDSVDIALIQSHLSEKLPSYMLPRKIKSQASFPRNASGKVDKKQLAQMVRKEISTSLPHIARIEAVSEHEKQCVEIWEGLLKKSPIGINENFFELGGDSLLLTHMMLLVEKKLSLKPDFTRFLSDSTITALLKGIASHAAHPWEPALALIERIKPFQQAIPTDDILLTGATGHLGIYLLHHLLTQTLKTVHVIVRGKDIQHAKRRLDARYQALFSTAIDWRRLKVYLGSLNESQFGLDNADFLSLKDAVSVIIHSAAEVNHVADYARLEEQNVMVVKQLLEFSNTAGCQQFFYISTQFSALKKLPEYYMPQQTISHLHSGYEQSKFIAECLMDAAVKQNYPITTIRLPLIIDDQDVLLLEKNHFVAFVMKCLKMGAYPDLKNVVNVLPTKSVADFIALACHTNPNESKVYNALQHGIPLLAVFESLIHKTELHLKKMNYEDWREFLINSTDETDIFYKFLPLYTTLTDDINTNPQRIDCDTYQAAVGEKAPITQIDEISAQLVAFYQRYIQPKAAIPA